MGNNSTDQRLFIYKKPCPECNGDMVMIYEPYKESSGTRICGQVCIECGFVRVMKSDMAFSWYTGKNKKDEWYVDQINIYDFHPVAVKIIENMKSGGFFKSAKRQNETKSTVRPGNSKSSQTNDIQPKTRHNQPRDTQPYTKSTYDQPRYKQSPFLKSSWSFHSEASSGRSYNEPIVRPFIYGVDMDLLYQNKEYGQLIDLYREKSAKGYELDDNELFRYAYSLGEVNRHSDAISVLSEFIKRFPNHENIAAAYNNRGCMYSRINALEHSTNDYRVAIAHNYKDSQSLRKIIADREKKHQLEMLLKEAKNLYEKEKYKEAAAKYEYAIKQGAELKDQWFYYGLIQSALENNKQTIFAFNEYIKLYPQSVAAYQNRGNAYWLTKLYDRALDDYCFAWTNLGLEDKQRFAYIEKRIQAVQALHKAIKAYDNKDYGVAAGEFEKFKACEDLGSYWKFYGLSLYYLDRNVEAEHAFSKALEIKKNPFVYERRGAARLKNGRYKLAAEDYWQSYGLTEKENSQKMMLNNLIICAEYSRDAGELIRILNLQRKLGFADELKTGKIFMKMENYQEAIDCLSRVNTAESMNILNQCRTKLCGEKHQTNEVDCKTLFPVISETTKKSEEKAETGKDGASGVPTAIADDDLFIMM